MQLTSQQYWEQITKDRCKAGWVSKYRTFRKLVKFEEEQTKKEQG